MFLWILPVVAVMRAAGSTCNHVQPLGIRMCEDQCRDTRGCNRYMFSAIMLACFIPNKPPYLGSGSDKDLDLVARNTYDHTNPKKKTDNGCSNFSQLIYNRKRMIACVACEPKTKPTAGAPKKKQTTGKSKTKQAMDAPKTIQTAEPTTKKGTTTPSLLISDYYNYKSNLRQLFLHNSSVKPYNLLKLSNILTLVYSRLSKLLYVATHSPNIIASYHENRKQSSVGTKVRVNAMAVDGKNDILFFVGKNGLYKTKPVKCIVCSSKKWKEFHNIATDPNNKIIFICIQSVIYAYNYRGGNKLIIHNVKPLPPAHLHFDPTRNVLYYFSWNTLMEVSLANLSARKILSFSNGMKPSSFVVNEHYLCMAVKNRGDQVISCLAGKKDTFEKTVENKRDADLKLCFID